MRALPLLLALTACADATGIVGGGPSSPGDPVELPDNVPTSPTDAVDLGLRINELASSNRAGPEDETGGHPDWIELYNPTAADLSLNGWSLADADEDPQDFADGLVVPAGGYLVVWADEQPELGASHVDLLLSSDGDAVTLAIDDLIIDTVAFGPLLPDMTLARTPDGGAEWEVRDAGTPGEANGGEPQDGPQDPGGCAPTLAVVEEHLLEGDALDASWSCASAGERELTLHGPGVADPAGAWTWATTLADAGRYDALLEVETPGHVGVPETAVATLWVADDWEDPANVPVDPAAYTEEWGLPVLHLDPDGALSESYVPMTATFEGVTYQGQMKIRGAASAGYPKNSYTLEFDPIQLPLDDFGLQDKDHLVLVTTFDDNAYTRQKLVYDTWAELATWTGEARMAPRSFFVVVHLDGGYHGLYVGIDHVDDEFLREMGFDDSGPLFKSVTHDANFYLTSAAGVPKGAANLSMGWEKKEGLPEDDLSAMDDLTAWSASSSHATFAAEVDARLDRDQFMDWFLLVHHFAADDSAGKNAYAYEEPLLGYWLVTPWDFNHALGQTWQTARVGPDTYNEFVWNNGIFWHLQEEPTLSAELWDRYASQREPGGPLEVGALTAKLDAYYAQIDDSAQRDWDRWDRQYVTYGGWSWRGDFTTYEEEKAYLYGWVADRDTWMWSYHPAP